MKKLNSVTPHLFEKFLVLSISYDWINQFGKIPTFDVFVENKKLCLVSKEKLKGKRKFLNQNHQIKRKKL